MATFKEHERDFYGAFSLLQKKKRKKNRGQELLAGIEAYGGRGMRKEPIVPTEPV